MDKIARYRTIIRDLLTPYTGRRYSGLNVVNEPVFDEPNDRYLVVVVGWEGNIRRIYHNLLHLDIIDGKIWIQRDGTEDGIGYALEAAGVPKEDIVPAFHPEDVRPLVGYGVG
jgi:hypothetical protein